MAISVCEVSISESPLALPASAGDAAAGAIVDFFGVVRALENEREISGIEYEAHRLMAKHQMHALGLAAADRFDLKRVLIQHRIGFVPVAEPSVMVRVESSHRSAAFSASQWIMDELKRTVPIWKHPVFKDDDLARSFPDQSKASLDSSALA
jgi:molybdopterin synthase catalytic subunit